MRNYMNGNEMKEGHYAVVNDVDGGQFLAGQLTLVNSKMVLVAGCTEFALNDRMEVVRADDAFNAFETTIRLSTQEYHE